MKIVRQISSIFERHLTENARAEAAEVKAVMDYNIMMGNIEDPSEEESEVESDG